MTTLGLIGLGRIGAFHSETLMNLPELDGLVITDERPDVVAQVAAKYGATPVNSVAELLACGVDGVVVAAATPAHAALTLAAVEAGLPTFCEKPVAATAEESAHVAEVIGRSGVPVQIGYQRRFDAAFAAAKAAVDGGTLGALHTVRSTTMDPAPPPLDYIKGSGGIFRDCAVHDFDTVRWITNQEAVEVYATGSVQGDPLFTEYGDVDTAAVVVRFDGGALGVISNARYNGRGYDCRLEVHGFEDTVVAGWLTADFRQREPQVAANMKAMLEASPVQGYLACCQALSTLDQRDLLPKVKSPTLVIAGRHDMGTPVSAAELIRSLVPGASMTVLDAAHISNVEQSQAFTEAVLGFLTQGQV
mgnify:CR=1 FL=1